MKPMQGKEEPIDEESLIFKNFNGAPRSSYVWIYPWTDTGMWINKFCLFLS